MPRSRMAISVVLAVLFAAGCGGHAQASRPPTTPDKPTVIALPDLPPQQSIKTIPGVVTITATPSPDWIQVAHGIAWVANVAGGVARYRADGHRLGVVPTGSDVCLAMDQGFGSVWAVGCDAGDLVRMDARTGRLQSRISLGTLVPVAESSLAVGPPGVFLLDGRRGIARVDPRTNRVAERRLPAPDAASAMRFGFGSLWVSSESTGVVTRIDPATGDVQATIAGAPGTFLAAGEGAIWVLDADAGTVHRIDPVTNTLAATIPVDIKVHGGDIAVGHGSVWARVSGSLVSRIDPATNKVVSRYGFLSGSGSVAADEQAVWISAHDETSIWRVPLD